MTTPPPLFKDTKEFLVVLAILIGIILLRYLFIYQDYKNLKSLPIYYSNATVINIYKKNSKKGNLFKLKTPNLIIYLYSKKNYKRFDLVRVKFKLKKSTNFSSFIKGSFVYGTIIERLRSGKNYKKSFVDFISKQHKNQDISNFYSAIFLAEPLSKSLREKISILGISHLVALSGFHLGIIWLIIFTILTIPYRYFQQRVFPYRNIYIDLGIIALFLIAIFVFYVGYPPSLLRTFVMLLIGYIVLIFGLELVSFKLLIFTTLLILAIFPKLLFSIALWLSIFGVFYIFLILKWLKGVPNLYITIIAIPFGLFILMFPIAHFLFKATSIWQVSSPFLSVLFIIFYPISAISHIFEYGYIFDKYLLELFNAPINSINIDIPLPLVIIYLVLSISSIFSKKIFVATSILALAITLYSLKIAF